jgi:biotin synthase
VCGKPFEAGAECVSALFNAPDAGFERRDYCVGCWDKRPDGGEPFSQWQGAYAPPRSEQARKEPIAHETAEDLLRRLIDIGDPANVNVVYILAVMLERKKQLIERSAVPVEGGIMRFYEHKASGDTFQILDPQISLDAIGDVQRQIIEMLGPRKPSERQAAPMASEDQAITKEEALALLAPERRQELRERAHKVTLECVERRFDFCSIIGAKSGKCPEDCKWCAQSAHWQADCAVSGWVGTEACVEAARAAEANGADRIGIVTSGRALEGADLDAACEAIRAIRAQTSISVCASLGIVSEESLARLKEAGLQRIHCNLETAPSLFPSLCSTHTQEDKLATLQAAKRLGFEICCGGIIGMGETDEQLVEFAFALHEIAPDSIPVNVLHPIRGTPLGERGILDPERVIDAVALLRLVNPSTPLRFAGGRRDMTDETAASCIYVGMSAGIAGHLLTTPGADFGDDRELARRAGYAVKGK